MTSPYIFTVPITPPSLNAYRKLHWSKQSKVREAFQEQVWASLNEKGNRCPRGLERVELHAVIQFSIHRRRDGDNYGSMLWKFTQDTLTREGVIPDDTPDHCLAHQPVLLIGRRDLTIITIEDVAA